MTYEEGEDEMRTQRLMLVGAILVMLVCGVTYVTADQTRLITEQTKKYADALVMDEKDKTDNHVEQAIQNERLSSHTASIDKLSQLVAQQDVRINAIDAQMSMLRGIGIGFGALLGFLQSIQVLLTLQGRKGRN